MIFAQCAVLLHRSSMYNYWNQIPCMLASRIVKALQEKQLFHGGEGHSVKLLSFFSSLLYKFFNFLFQGWAISCWCVLRCQCLHRASHSAWWGRCIPGRKNRQTPQTSTGGKYCKYFSLNADATALRIHTVWKCLKKSHFMRFCRQILHSTFWHENQFLSEKRKKYIIWRENLYNTFLVIFKHCARSPHGWSTTILRSKAVFLCSWDKNCARLFWGIFLNSSNFKLSRKSNLAIRHFFFLAENFACKNMRVVVRCGVGYAKSRQFVYHVFHTFIFLTDGIQILLRFGTSLRPALPTQRHRRAVKFKMIYHVLLRT